MNDVSFRPTPAARPGFIPRAASIVQSSTRAKRLPLRATNAEDEPNGGFYVKSVAGVGRADDRTLVAQLCLR
jgi:hypothetical protein